MFWAILESLALLACGITLALSYDREINGPAPRRMVCIIVYALSILVAATAVVLLGVTFDLKIGVGLAVVVLVLPFVAQMFHRTEAEREEARAYET